MQYDESTIQKLGVNPESWGWFNKDYSIWSKEKPAPKELSAEARKFASVPFSISVLSFLGYAAAFLYPWFTSGDFPLLEAIIGTVLLLGIICCVFGLLIPGLIVVGVTVALSILDFFTGYVAGGFLLLGAIVLGFVFVCTLIYGLPSGPTRNKPDKQEQRVFGKPGGVGSAVSKFGAQAVSAGVAGEMSTAALLDLLLKIPGVTIYHGLKFPGSDTADVDHAVVHGRRVFLIDSKQYRSGEYRWLTEYDGWSPEASNGWGTQPEVIKGGGHEMNNSMSAAEEGFRELLGDNVVLSSLVVVHGKDIRINDSCDVSPSGVKLCTADYAMQFMGIAFGLNLPKWKDDRKLQSIMRKQLK